MRLFVNWKDLWPRPPQVKHLKELVLTVSSVGVDDEACGLKLLLVLTVSSVGVDDEACGLKLLVVGGGRLEVVEVFL